MAKHYKIFKRIKKIRRIKNIKPIILAVVVLLILLAGFLLFFNFVSKKANNYFIQNKYYSLKLQTPAGWVAKEKTLYSEDNITQILTDCKNDKSTSASAYGIGEFRFESQRYPQDLDITKFATTGLPSGMILEIKINCLNGGSLQYASNKYINISPGDKNNEAKLRENYTAALDKIISNFQFTK